MSFLRLVIIVHPSFSKCKYSKFFTHRPGLCTAQTVESRSSEASTCLHKSELVYQLGTLNQNISMSSSTL